MRYLKVLVVSLFLVLALLVPTLVKAQGPSLEKRLAKLEKKVRKLEAKLANVSVEDGTINGLIGPHFIFTGANVHIRSGSGSTDDFTFVPETFDESAVLLGLGNLVVGYNEDGVLFGLPVTDRTGSGSHNLIMGVKHKYPSFSGFVAGFNNTISGEVFSAVSGGLNNEASGDGSSVSGGDGNTASGPSSSVSGGDNNMASGGSSSVSGGFNHTASGNHDWRAGSFFQDN